MSPQATAFAVTFLRINQIIGDSKLGTTPLVPVSRSSWWAGVATGRFPPATKLGSKTTVWRSDDIRRLIETGDWRETPPTDAPQAAGRGGVR